jgi:hypothetical protein
MIYIRYKAFKQIIIPLELINFNIQLDNNTQPNQNNNDHKFYSNPFLGLKQKYTLHIN